MTVSQRIIAANDQPNDGDILTSVAGARGLDASSKLDANHTLAPPIPTNIGQASGVINSNLQTRFDDYNYYHGSGVQG